MTLSQIRALMQNPVIGPMLRNIAIRVVILSVLVFLFGLAIGLLVGWLLR